MKKIYVGNLSFDTTEEQLRELFAAHGTVNSVAVITDRMSGRSRGFGFVEMEDDGEASAAIAGVNGTELDGRTLTVNEARPRSDRSGPSGGRGESRGRGQRW